VKVHVGCYAALLNLGSDGGDDDDGGDDGDVAEAVQFVLVGMSM
jgi:hypothetical protein